MPSLPPFLTKEQGADFFEYMKLNAIVSNDKVNVLADRLLFAGGNCQ